MEIIRINRSNFTREHGAVPQQPSSTLSKMLYTFCCLSETVRFNGINFIRANKLKEEVFM